LVAPDVPTRANAEKIKSRARQRVARVRRRYEAAIVDEHDHHARVSRDGPPNDS